MQLFIELESRVSLTRTKDQNAPKESLIQNDSKTPRLGGKVFKRRPIIDCHVDKKIRTRDFGTKKKRNKSKRKRKTNKILINDKTKIKELNKKKI